MLCRGLPLLVLDRHSFLPQVSLLPPLLPPQVCLLPPQVYLLPPLLPPQVYLLLPPLLPPQVYLLPPLHRQVCLCLPRQMAVRIPKGLLIPILQRRLLDQRAHRPVQHFGHEEDRRFDRRHQPIHPYGLKVLALANLQRKVTSIS
jgi:hypothetical protein